MNRIEFDALPIHPDAKPEECSGGDMKLTVNEKRTDVFKWLLKLSTMVANKGKLPVLGTCQHKNSKAAAWQDLTR